MVDRLKSKSSSLFAMNVLLHCILLFTFLSLFFFLYISKVEEGVFQSEVGNLIDDSIKSSVLNNPQTQQLLKPLIPVLKRYEKIYETDTDFTKERNRSIQFTAGFVIIFLVGILITIIATLYVGCNHELEIKGILLENIVIFMFVGIIEYIFFTKIAVHFIPVVPSLMVTTVINKLKEQLES